MGLPNKSKAVLNKNSTLSNVEKLSYFLNFVTEIKDLQLSNSTYQTALDLLNERYNIPQITISLLMSNLWNLETWELISDLKGFQLKFPHFKLKHKSGVWII